MIERVMIMQSFEPYTYTEFMAEFERLRRSNITMDDVAEFKSRQELFYNQLDHSEEPMADNQLRQSIRNKVKYLKNKVLNSLK